MATTEQTYATHVHRPRLSTGASVFGVAALALFLIEVVRDTRGLTIGLVFLAVSVLFLVAISRIYIVRLQDRIILLEMRVRLARLGREADYGRLSKRQLVALRFASDAELPALIERAIAERLTSQQIKQAVRSWQADLHRT